MFVLLFGSVFFCNVYFSSAHYITVYGDIYQDRDFFVRTFPWIVDNIGGRLSVQFYMQGSGRYTVPQMCALEQLRHNTFLQAQYLKCEAEERPGEVCLCESGIDSERFQNCVMSGGDMAAESAQQFQQLGVDVTPLVELGPRSTVFGVEDTWFLKKICTIFEDNLPMGCLKPFECNGTQALNSRRAIAQFDRCCADMECRRSEEITTTSPVTTSPATTALPTTNIVDLYYHTSV